MFQVDSSTAGVVGLLWLQVSLERTADGMKRHHQSEAAAKKTSLRSVLNGTLLQWSKTMCTCDSYRGRTVAGSTVTPPLPFLAWSHLHADVHPLTGGTSSRMNHDP